MLTAVTSYITKCFCKNYREFLETNFVFKLFERGRRGARICLVPRGLADLVDSVMRSVEKLSAGLIVGWLRGSGEFVPSPHLFNLARNAGFDYGCAVVAKPHGVKAFLYGNNLLVASVERFLHPVEKGMYVAIVDSEDMMAIGVGRLVVSAREFEELLAKGDMTAAVVINMFDLGVVLRNDKLI